MLPHWTPLLLITTLISHQTRRTGGNIIRVWTKSEAHHHLSVFYTVKLICSQIQNMYFLRRAPVLLWTTDWDLLLLSLSLYFVCVCLCVWKTETRLRKRRLSSVKMPALWLLWVPALLCLTHGECLKCTMEHSRHISSLTSFISVCLCQSGHDNAAGTCTAEINSQDKLYLLLSCVVHF